jgi:hypothetical protein
MTYKFLTAGVLVVIAAASTPAEKHDFLGKCAKPDVLQNVAAGDKEGHRFFLRRGKCETTSGEVAGEKSKQGEFGERGEAAGTQPRGWGDKIFYSYQTAGTTKDGTSVSGGKKYQITRGTGK